jgi:dTDP-glucose 4,6-dehydratase
MSKERVLVIGSNSFSGSHFVQRLLEDEWDVIGISRSREPHTVFLPYQWQILPGKYQFHALDLNTDFGEISKIIHDFQPNYVVNFAAQGMVAESWEHPEHWYQTNIVSMVRLHNDLRCCKLLKKYVHVTTPEVYGNTRGWVTEDHPFDPSTPYAVSRAACDMSLKAFQQAYDFPVVYTRSANVYGPGQQLYRIIPRTILSIRLGKKLPLHGGGHSVRSFIYIRDVTNATLLIMKHASMGQTYHLSTIETISIRDLVLTICQKFEADFDEVVEESQERRGKDQAYLLDSSKVRNELNWSDEVKLDSGLDRTLEWIDNNIEVLREHPLDYIHKQ